MRRTRVHSDRGAAAVEFAILFPLLLLIVFGIVDFGYALYSQHTLTQAAREGARLEAMGQADTSEVEDRARDAANGVVPERLTVTVTSDCPDAEDATVLIEYEYQYLTPVGGIAGLFGDGFGEHIQMSAEGVMPCEA